MNAGCMCGAFHVCVGHCAEREKYLAGVVRCDDPREHTLEIEVGSLQLHAWYVLHDVHDM